MTHKTIMTLGAGLLLAATASAGSLSVDDLSVQQSAQFYGTVDVYSPGGDLPMGAYTNLYGQASTNQIPSGPGSSPVGAIHMYAATNAPSGWLLCNGAAVGRTNYSQLFFVIGTAYGVGNGSTTFNVPNMVQRFPLGVTNALGATGGASSVTLTVNQMPAHTHNIQYSPTQKYVLGPGAADAGRDGADTGFTTLSTGGGQPHTNMPPYLTVNYIIKY